MESAKSTEDLAPRMTSENSRVHLVLIVISLVVAIIALVLSCVGVSLKGTTQIILPSEPSGTSQESSQVRSSDDKIWAIALGHGNYNEAYIDEETGTLKGFLVDLTNAVCRSGNKNCRIVYDIWTRCWDSEEGQVARGGIGLMSDWYDGCAGWLGTYDRFRTYGFSEPFGKGDPETLFVKPGSSLASTWKDATNKKIGILDGWWTDESCLNRNADSFTSGAPFDSNLIVHYADPTDLVEAVMDGDVHYAFQSVNGYVASQLDRVDGDPVLPCTVHGPAMMTRQVNQEFLSWWNAAQKQLMESPEYESICSDLDEEHGHMPGLTSDNYCYL